MHLLRGPIWGPAMLAVQEARLRFSRPISNRSRRCL